MINKFKLAAFGVIAIAVIAISTPAQLQLKRSPQPLTADDYRNCERFFEEVDQAVARLADAYPQLANWDTATTVRDWNMRNVDRPEYRFPALGYTHGKFEYGQMRPRTSDTP